MPDYRIRASGEIVSDLSRAFPDCLIPQPPKASDLDFLGVDPILEGPRPTPGHFQSVVRSGPIEDGLNWFWTYDLVDYAPDAVAAATEKQWEAVRMQRSALLASSDWTQLPDCPLSNIKQTAWATYRQALRDITHQADPFAIVWPEVPE